LAILFRPLGLLACKSFYYERTRWRLFQNRILRTKLDIYLFCSRLTLLLTHNYSLQIYILPHSDTWSWFQVNRSLFLWCLYIHSQISYNLLQCLTNLTFYIRRETRLMGPSNIGNEFNGCLDYQIWAWRMRTGKVWNEFEGTFWAYKCTSIT
jgi:hypothetical protein